MRFPHLLFLACAAFGQTTTDIFSDTTTSSTVSSDISSSTSFISTVESSTETLSTLLTETTETSMETTASSSSFVEIAETIVVNSTELVASSTLDPTTSMVSSTQSSSIQSSPIQSSPIQSSPIQSSPIQSSPIQSSPIQSSSIQSSSIQSSSTTSTTTVTTTPSPTRYTSTPTLAGRPGVPDIKKVIGTTISLNNYPPLQSLYPPWFQAGAQGLPAVMPTIPSPPKSTAQPKSTIKKTTAKTSSKTTTKKALTTKVQRDALFKRVKYSYVYLDNYLDSKSGDNQAAFQRAASNCPKVGCFLTFRTSQKGVTYRMTGGGNPTALYIRDKQDFIFDGQGALFLFSRTKLPGANFNDGSCSPKPWKMVGKRGGGSANGYSNGFMAVDSCQRCIMRNYEMDWDWNTARLGDIVQAQAGNTNRTWVLKFLTGNNFGGPPGSFRSLHAVNPETLGVGHVCQDEWFPKYYPSSVKPHASIPNTWIVTWPVDVPGRKFKSAPVEGTYYMLKRFIYDIHGTIIKRCVDCRFENVDVYGVPGKAFTIGEDCKQMEFINVNLVKPRTMSNLGKSIKDLTKDYRAITATADALFFENIGGNILIKNCEISWHGDDAVNVHDNIASGDQGLVELSPKMYQINGSRFLGIAPGDTIEVLYADFTSTKFTSLVTSSQTNGCGGWILNLEKPLIIPGLTLDQSRKLYPTLMLVNTRFTSAKVVLDGVNFHHHRGRGGLIQAPEIIIQNSQFHDEQQPGIVVRADATWKQLEGKATYNVLIFNNTFARSDANGYYDALLTVFDRFQNDTVAWKVGGALNSLRNGNVTMATFRGISIVGNKFYDTPSGAIHLSSTADAVIFGNQIYNNANLVSDTNVTIGSGQWGYVCSPVGQRGEIMVRGSVNVLVKANEWHGTAPGGGAGSLQYAADRLETFNATRNVIVTNDNVLL